jgi:hypothetical protein
MKLSKYISNNWLINLSASFMSATVGVAVYSKLPYSAQTLEILSNALTDFNDVAKELVKEYIKTYPSPEVIAGISICSGMASLLLLFAKQRSKPETPREVEKAFNLEIASGISGYWFVMTAILLKVLKNVKKGDNSGLQFLYYDRLISHFYKKATIPFAFAATGVYGYAAIRKLISPLSNPGTALQFNQFHPNIDTLPMSAYPKIAGP